MRSPPNLAPVPLHGLPPMILKDHESILRLLSEPEESVRSDGEGAHRYAAFVACYKGRSGGAPLARLGECGSLREALERLADAVAQRSGIEGPDAGALLSERLGITVPDTDFARWLVDERRWAVPYLQRLTSAARRFFAYWVLGWASGSFRFLDTELADSAYIGPLCTLYPAWRCVLGLVASPPHQDEAACILELPPKRRLGKQDKALLAACAAGEIRGVEQALAAGADVNGRDPDGNTSLHHAVAHRRTEVVRRLLAAGADPDQQSPFGSPRGNTPLHELLDRGYSASELDPAVLVAIVELFLRHGAKAIRNAEGKTAAELAQSWAQRLLHYESAAALLRAAPAVR
ncbi:MAG: ankyrin repeat domain-containing protein [Polyangia bacterium]